MVIPLKFDPLNQVVGVTDFLKVKPSIQWLTSLIESMGLKVQAFQINYNLLYILSFWYEHVSFSDGICIP